jgi:hypothetical protein
MELTTLVILVLSAWVLALLVWFEVNSRRNKARPNRQSTPRDGSAVEEDALR